MKMTVHIVPKGQMRARHATVNGFSRTHKDSKQAPGGRGTYGSARQVPAEKAHAGSTFARPKSASPHSGRQAQGLEGRSARRDHPANRQAQPRQPAQACHRLPVHAPVWGDDRQVVGSTCPTPTNTTATGPGGKLRSFRLRRHLPAWKEGEAVDTESGLPRLAHVLCNAAFLVALEKI